MSADEPNVNTTVDDTHEEKVEENDDSGKSSESRHVSKSRKHRHRSHSSSKRRSNQDDSPSLYRDDKRHDRRYHDTNKSKHRSHKSKHKHHRRKSIDDDDHDDTEGGEKIGADVETRVDIKETNSTVVNEDKSKDIIIEDKAAMIPSPSLNNKDRTTEGTKKKGSKRLKMQRPFKKKKKIEEPRTIYCNNQERNALNKFAVNSIKTTKYTIISFLPKNLFEQFRRVANFYFLIIACLQLVPGLSAVNPFSSILPLIIVLAVTAIKEAYEDWKRQLSDKATNNTPAVVMRGGDFTRVPWSDVVVGDFIRIHNGESLPADMVLLNSSENQGLCYVETANLDGETNLKLHQALPETTHLKSPSDLVAFNATVECEPPNNRLYTFVGYMRIGGGEKEKLSLGVKQVLLRGCVLKNTEWVYGLVIYTGPESKLMQNATAPPSKRTLLEKQTNRALLRIFSFLMCICLAGGIASGIWTHYHGERHWYINRRWNAGLTGLVNFFSFMISFSVMIPISLYVSMEMVKLAQAFLIGTDLQMYYPFNDTPARARTSNLSEELGQVQYIFSDKTGTLTRNVMEFFKCSVAGRSYGTGLTEIAITKAKREKRKLQLPDPTPLPGADAGFSFNDMRLFEDLKSEERRGNLVEFFTLLAVCHTVIPERDDDNKIIFQAASPDEGALVFAAKNLGFFFHTRNPKDIICNILGTDMEFQILNVLEFNSTRKRMSVICKDPEGRIKLYCKGADTVIFERLSPGQDSIKTTTLSHLEDYASDGLRTLCLAMRELDPLEYQRWNTRHHEASVALNNRDQLLDEVAEMIEKGLTLIGATAIEDKLQEGVPDAIFTLAKANIKIWVLTGDKQETAINIGFACSLLTQTMTVMIINAPTAEDTDIQLQQALHQSEKQGEYGLVIDGHTLIFALDKTRQMTLLTLARRCAAVICCRVSPLQKAEVVTLVKDNEKAITLAIGDGANDVSMIQQAHIGVGISGQEGMQAVMSSDYAIAQFRFLVRLLLVHGRYDYKRVTKLILYSFYKNMVFSLSQFGFNWYNGWSAQTMYDGWSMTIFNVVFTGIPVIVYAILEQDVPLRTLKKYPQLYETGQKSQEFNLKLLFYWLLTGVYQGFMVFFGAYLLYDKGVVSSTGRADSMYTLGALCYVAVILIVNLRLALESRFITIMSGVAIAASALAWFVWMAIYSKFPYFLTDGNMYYVAYNLWSTASFWLAVVFLVVLCLFPVVAFEYYTRTYQPRNYQIIQELEKIEKSPDTEKYENDEISGMTNGNVEMKDVRKTSLPEKKKAYAVKNSISERESSDRFTGFSFSPDLEGTETVKMKFRKQNTSKKNIKYGRAK